jgi:hypothetical protein
MHLEVEELFLVYMFVRYSTGAYSRGQDVYRSLLIIGLHLL